MTMIDPEQERRRLAEFYSLQLDGELEKIARQAYDLTDTAREALRAEFVRRGLSVELKELRPVRPAPPAPIPLPGDPPPERPVQDISPKDGELQFRDLVMIRSYWNLLDAELARGALESAGIECFLFDDNMIRMDWFAANGIGGVKLRVDPQNVEAANRILDEEVKESPASDEPESPA